VLRLHPQDVAAHYMLGNALLLQGRPGEAIPHYEHALRFQPGLEDARRNLELARRRAATP
jgi:cytochrome c-type biogenesis protein CcmH/NrfG